MRVALTSPFQTTYYSSRPQLHPRQELNRAQVGLADDNAFLGD